MTAASKQSLKPDQMLVSLQEADRWFTGSLLAPNTGLCGSMTLEFGMVRDLMKALEEQGGHYKIAVLGPQRTIPAGPGLILPSTKIIPFEDFHS